MIRGLQKYYHQFDFFFHCLTIREMYYSAIQFSLSELYCRLHKKGFGKVYAFTYKNKKKVRKKMKKMYICNFVISKIHRRKKISKRCKKLEQFRKTLNILKRIFILDKQLKKIL